MEPDFEEGYYFYVLSKNYDDFNNLVSVNLIMDRNMYYNKSEDVGVVSTKDNNGNTSWYNANTNADGPVIALNYLYNVTKDWFVIPNIDINYVNSTSDNQNGYNGVFTTKIKNETVTKIIAQDGITETAVYKNLRARLPYLSEVKRYDTKNKSNAYLYDYLEDMSIQENIIPGIFGYWLLSSNLSSSATAMFVRYCGNIYYYFPTNTKVGVRPVITLEI